MYTQTQEALKMAIEALEKCKEAYLAGPNWQKVGYDILDKSHKACKEALAQPAQEPVGRFFVNANMRYEESKDGTGTPLYTHPAPSESFIGGSVCPSCGNHSLFKTDKSEWCVTHKCLWQADYVPSWRGLSDDDIDAIKTKAITGAKGLDVDKLLHLIASLTEQTLRTKNEFKMGN